jgi:hypothetical protein
MLAEILWPQLPPGFLKIHFNFKGFFPSKTTLYAMLAQILWPQLPPGFLKVHFNFKGFFPKNHSLCYVGGEVRKVCGKVFEP